MKFFVEVYVRSADKNVLFEWRKVRPPQGNPYEYETVVDAVKMVKIYYPDGYGRVRIVDSNGEVWKHFV